MDKVLEYLQPQFIIEWFIVFVIVALFLYKFWPDFYGKVSKKTKKDVEREHQLNSMNERDKKIEDRLDSIEQRLNSIESNLQRDSQRMDTLEAGIKHDREVRKKASKESAIQMRALLAIITALQEQGANGPTKAARKEIEDYLTDNVCNE